MLKRRNNMDKKLKTFKPGQLVQVTDSTVNVMCERRNLPKAGVVMKTNGDLVVVKDFDGRTDTFHKMYLDFLHKNPTSYQSQAAQEYPLYNDDTSEI